MGYNEESGNGTAQTAPSPDHNVTGDDAMATSKSTRSPAFQWYPESWFGSSRVQRMSHTERGIYVDLLGFAWLENGLPTDIKQIAAMVKLPVKRFERIWAGPIHECFFERNGKLFNPRQERERKKQSEHRKQKQGAAEARWEKERDARAVRVHPTQSASAMPSVSVSVSDPVSEKKEQVSDSSPTVLVFPVSGNPQHPTWNLTQGRIDGWKAAYPHLDVTLECRRALTWVEANTPKTAKGMPAFLVRWLNTATNRGGRILPLAATGTEGRGRTGAPPKGKYDGIEEQD